VQVTPGNLVSANSTGTGLVTITQMKPLRVTFTLPERDLPVLQRRSRLRPQLYPVTASVPDSGKPGRGQAQLRRFQRRHDLGHDHRQGRLQQ
jgi:multidrug efflux system membrane fusion protein